MVAFTKIPTHIHKFPELASKCTNLYVEATFHIFPLFGYDTTPNHGTSNAQRDQMETKLKQTEI